MPLPIAPGGLFTFPSSGSGGIGGGCIRRLSAIPRVTGSFDDVGTFGMGTGAGSVGGGPTLLADIVGPRRIYGHTTVNNNFL